jgi:hypothetical protein
MRAYLLVTRTLFGIIALVHLTRIFTHWPAVIGQWAAPVWVSGVGFLVAGGLSLWSAQLSRRLSPTG